MMMKKLGYDDVLKVVKLHGTLDPDKITLFSIMRDEMYFLPAFLEHYRKLGFEQFMIFDDQSKDGSTEYLLSQPDCVVVTSRLRYGTDIRLTLPTGKKRRQRAGIYLKGALPRSLMPGKYVTYVDADEFMLLPPNSGTIGDVIARLQAADASGLVGTMVEFFPERFQPVATVSKPAEFGDLVAESPFFEAEPLLEVDGTSILPRFLNPSKTTRLFDKYQIEEEEPEEPGFFQRLMGRKKKTLRKDSRSARHKTVIARHDQNSYLLGTHKLNVSPLADHYVTLAHFVFTPSFPAKVAAALEWNAHANGALKYKAYDRLLKALAADPENTLLSENSRRFTGPKDLIEAGLMRWPDHL